MAEPTPVPSGNASPRFVSEDRRKYAFRSLVSDVAEHLSDTDIKSIIWHKEVPTSLRTKTALEILEYLYKHGVYTEYEVRPLAQLLKDIHREDLTSRVDTFWKQFGRHFSTIDSMRRHNERQIVKGRRSTLSGSNPLPFGMTPHTEVPTIVTTIEAHQESPESSATLTDDDIEKYLVNSSPGSQNMLITPSQPQAHDQIEYAVQNERLNTTTTPLHHPYRSHSSNIARLTSEGNLLPHTGSSISLQRISSRISEPTIQENLSASCSQLELPSQRYFPQWYISPSNPSSHNVNQENTQNSDIMEPTALHPSPPATSNVIGYDQRPPSLSSLPAFVTDQHINTSPLNGNHMPLTIHPHMLGRPMSRSVSQEYYHMAHGHRHPVTYGSRFNPSPAGSLKYHGSPNCSPNGYAIVPEAVPQNSHSETDLLHSSICSCIQNQCPHCGTFSRDVPMAHHVPVVCVPVAYTHNESLNQVQTHPINHHGEVLTMSSPIETPNSMPKTASESTSTSGECVAKCSTNRPSSAIGKPIISNSESEYHGHTNDDHELNQAAVYDGDEESHDRLASNMKPLESSNKKRVTKQRPHSATTGASDATSTCNASAKIRSMYSLHSSADNMLTHRLSGSSSPPLAKNRYTSSFNTSSSLSAPAAKPNWKHVLFHAKPKSMLQEPNKLIWPIKRDKLNKYIYKHTNKLKTCKAKLELIPEQDNGPLPKFVLQLHPYGSEEDRNKCVTAKVMIEFPKKCRLHSKTKLEFEISAREEDPSTGNEIGHRQAQQEQVTQSFFYIKKFITHEELKASQCSYIYVIAAVRLIHVQDTSST